ncbi:MAG TPA: YciI family protein [Thermomicrobiales bacterium]|nr:YciI family protein [Thermomicrobiales bacterium]
MRYVLLIHVDEARYPELSQADQEARMAGYQAFGARHQDKILGGDALHEVATATAVRVRDGKALTTDGPFAETKEQLNGFYLVKCDNLDEAVALAAEIPDAVRGTIEVRPVMEFE